MLTKILIPVVLIFMLASCMQQEPAILVFSETKGFRHESIENGNNTLYVDNYRRYLIYKYGEKCMECGWDKKNPVTNNVPIQLDHIDGNSDNNSLDNLKLLCPNCHSLTPTFGALNKGNGRELRRLKRNEKMRV